MPESGCSGVLNVETTVKTIKYTYLYLFFSECILFILYQKNRYYTNVSGHKYSQRHKSTIPGGIKLEKPTIRNQSVIHFVFFINGSPKAQDEEPACLKKVAWLTNSQDLES
jgi:hypothetical protein